MVDPDSRDRPVLKLLSDWSEMVRGWMAWQGAERACGDNQIDITPDMVRAGMDVLRNSGVAGEYDVLISHEVPVDVFCAMMAARSTCQSR
jgi:hypothetical protein